MIPTSWDIDDLCNTTPTVAAIVFGFKAEDFMQMTEGIKALREMAKRVARESPQMAEAVSEKTHRALVSDEEGRRFVLNTETFRMQLANYSPIRGVSLEEMERRELNSFMVQQEIIKGRETVLQQT